MAPGHHLRLNKKMKIAVRRRYILRRTHVVQKLALPHERDESAEVSKTRDASIRQAARDLDAGLIDTDNYTRIGEITGAPRHKRRLRP
jgi:hypothetical protein